MIGNLLLVALGGALGSALRYLNFLLAEHVLGRGFPYGTLWVNVLGSLLMGVGAAMLLGRAPALDRMPLFFLTGVLGGYTTFSAYALDGFRLFGEGKYGIAAFYFVGSPVLSLAGFAAGYALVRALVP